MIICNEDKSKRLYHHPTHDLLVEVDIIKALHPPIAQLRINGVIFIANVLTDGGGNCLHVDDVKSVQDRLHEMADTIIAYASHGNATIIINGSNYGIEVNYEVEVN